MILELVLELLTCYSVFTVAVGASVRSGLMVSVVIPMAISISDLGFGLPW